MKRLYVLVRKDLPASHQAVQAGHAVAAWCRTHPDWDNEVLVYLHVPDEAALLLQHEFLTRRGIEVRLFREEDLGGAATAMAAYHSVPRLVRQLLRHVPLMELSA